MSDEHHKTGTPAQEHDPEHKREEEEEFLRRRREHYERSLERWLDRINDPFPALLESAQTITITSADGVSRQVDLHDMFEEGDPEP